MSTPKLPRLMFEGRAEEAMSFCGAHGEVLDITRYGAESRAKARSCGQFRIRDLT